MRRKKPEELKTQRFMVVTMPEQTKISGERPRWFGIVKHINTKESVWFHGASTMLGFIEERSGMKVRTHPS